jgi:hypothetical protein
VSRQSGFRRNNLLYFGNTQRKAHKEEEFSMEKKTILAMVITAVITIIITTSLLVTTSLGVYTNNKAKDENQTSESMKNSSLDNNTENSNNNTNTDSAIMQKMAGEWIQDYANPVNADHKRLFSDGKWEDFPYLSTDYVDSGTFIIAREEAGIYYLELIIEHSTSPYIEIGTVMDLYVYDSINDRIGCMMGACDEEFMSWYDRQ